MYIELTDERKNTIGPKYLQQGPVNDKEELSELTIQDLNFLISSAGYFGKKGILDEDLMDEKKDFFYHYLIERLKSSDELYILSHAATNHPYLDAEGSAWLFSAKEYADKAIAHYSEQKLPLKSTPLDKSIILTAFADFHRLGIQAVLIDNGSYTCKVPCSEILPPPDFSKLPKISVPVTNPKLWQAQLQFFQINAQADDGPQFRLLRRRLENAMLSEILDARFIIPAKIEGAENVKPDAEGKLTLPEGSRVLFASLENKSKETYVPAFTDWMEFQKMYKKDEWHGQILSYDDLCTIAKDGGIVINPKGLPLSLDAQNRAAVEKYREYRTKLEDIKPTLHKSPRGTHFLVGEPAEYPTELVEALKKHMKAHKEIKKAYLQLKVEHDLMSYLILVDFKGDKDTVFKGIAANAIPHLNGMYLDMHDTDDWAVDITADLKPFYKRFF